MFEKFGAEKCSSLFHRLEKVKTNFTDDRKSFAIKVNETEQSFLHDYSQSIQIEEIHGVETVLDYDF